VVGDRNADSPASCAGLTAPARQTHTALVVDTMTGGTFPGRRTVATGAQPAHPCHVARLASHAVVIVGGLHWCAMAPRTTRLTRIVAGGVAADSVDAVAGLACSGPRATCPERLLGEAGSRAAESIAWTGIARRAASRASRTGAPSGGTRHRRLGEAGALAVADGAGVGGVGGAGGRCALLLGGGVAAALAVGAVAAGAAGALAGAGGAGGDGRAGDGRALALVVRLGAGLALAAAGALAADAVDAEVGDAGAGGRARRAIGELDCGVGGQRRVGRRRDADVAALRDVGRTIREDACLGADGGIGPERCSAIDGGAAGSTRLTDDPTGAVAAGRITASADAARRVAGLGSGCAARDDDQRQNDQPATQNRPP
jgi:hypothetical protein